MDRESLVLVLSDGDRGAREDRAWMINVSAGGVALHLAGRRALPRDALVMVELPLGTSISRLKTRCRVVRVSAGESDIVHLEFLDDSRLFRDTLEACLRQWKLDGNAATFRMRAA